MAQDQLDVRVICGSLRKGSYNAALARMLPKLAPAGMTITEAPPFDGFPHYNHDLATPADVTAFADGVRAADGVIFVGLDGHFLNWRRAVENRRKEMNSVIDRGDGRQHLRIVEQSSNHSRTSRWRSSRCRPPRSAERGCKIICVNP